MFIHCEFELSILFEFCVKIADQKMAMEGRKIGLAMDFSKGSKAALKWAIDGLLRKGDTLFIIHVKHAQGLESRNLIWSTSGTRKSLLFPILIISKC